MQCVKFIVTFLKVFTHCVIFMIGLTFCPRFPSHVKQVLWCGVIGLIFWLRIFFWLINPDLSSSPHLHLHQVQLQYRFHLSWLFSHVWLIGIHQNREIVRPCIVVKWRVNCLEKKKNFGLNFWKRPWNFWGGKCAYTGFMSRILKFPRFLFEIHQSKFVWFWSIEWGASLWHACVFQKILWLETANNAFPSKEAPWLIRMNGIQVEI